MLRFLQLSVQTQALLPVYGHHIQQYKAFMSQMDADSDGNISYQEYLTWHEHHIKKHFDILDKDSDGVLSEEEYFKNSEKLRKRLQNKFQDKAPLN